MFLILIKEFLIRTFFCIFSIIFNFIIFFFKKELILIYTINILFNPIYLDLFPYMEFQTINLLYYYYIKLCFFYSISINSPFIFYQIYLFFINGFIKKEKSYLKQYIYIFVIILLIFTYFFKNYIIHNLYTIYLNLQLNPENNLGIALDYNFQLYDFIDIIYNYYFFLCIVTLSFIYFIFFKKIILNKKCINHARKLYNYFFFFILIFIIPPIIKLQVFILIIFYSFFEFVIFILIYIYQKK